jgi:hypothetical protein
LDGSAAVHTLSPNAQFLADLISWAGVLVPVVLVFVTALIRSIVKSNRFFSGQNLYLGIDLCFAGLAATMVESLDLIREHLLSGDETQFVKVLTGLGLCFGSALCLLVVTKLHQAWDIKPPTAQLGGRVKTEAEQLKIDRKHKRRRFFWLGIASNGLGFTTIAVFAWLRARRLV